MFLLTPTLRSKSLTILRADILADGVRAELVLLVTRTAEKNHINCANLLHLVLSSERVIEWSCCLPVWLEKALSRFLLRGVAGREREAWTAE